RLMQIDDAGARRIDATATDPSLYTPLTGPTRAPGAIASLSQSGRALAVFLDLPLITGSEVAWSPRVAAYAAPWPTGGVAMMRSASDANYALDTLLTQPATLGRTTADFYSGPLWRWDTVNELRIRLSAGTLTSQDDLAVLGGANALAIENEDGEWEIVQFATATLTAPNEWTLTRLLRGQSGTESAMRAPVAAGARVMLLDTALKQLAFTRNEATLPFHYAYGPASKPQSDASWQTTERQFAANGLKPLAPVQLTAQRSGSDIALSWIRRTRIGGDSWDQTDVPLAEDNEAYDIEILDGLTVKRTLSAATNAVTYTAAQIATDFPGGLPSPFTFRVYQLSTTTGRGTAATARVTL
ncbi:MAG: hypothetical protein JO348_12980, partial [Alphaproteobacteria bacterium]|nr:hypothetical protein [Alphaproteobacteria bacterium]